MIENENQTDVAVVTKRGLFISIPTNLSQVHTKLLHHEAIEQFIAGGRSKHSPGEISRTCDAICWLVLKQMQSFVQTKYCDVWAAHAGFILIQIVIEAHKKIFDKQFTIKNLKCNSMAYFKLRWFDNLWYMDWYTSATMSTEECMSFN